MTALPRRSRTGAVVAAVVVAVTVLAVGCGVPIDSGPRAINRSTTTMETTSTTAPRDSVYEVTVYFVNNRDGLQAVNFDLSHEATPSDAINKLLSTTPRAPLKNRIPSGTVLTGLEPRGNLVTVDLSSAINDISGDSQKEAFAQIVFTVLEFPQYSRVSFRIDGKAVEAPTDSSNRSVVTAADYDPPLNPN